MSSNVPETQIVIHITAAGGPEVLRPARVPVPSPRAGEVLIAVKAAGVNRHDCNQRRRGPSPDHSDVPGLEVSGRVVAVGPGVPVSLMGQPVCALTDGGGYAPFAIAQAGQVLPVPDGLNWVQAAALPEAAFTVWHNFFGVARLGAGESVLIHGGTSGVGTLAIQVLNALGHPVYATCGAPGKVARALSLGARGAIDYRREDFVSELRRHTAGRGVDVILDMSGGQYAAANVEALAWRGRIVHLSPGAEAALQTPLRTLMAKEAVVTGSLLRPLPDAHKAVIAERLRTVLWPLINDRRVRPIVHGTLPLADAAKAHQVMEAGEHIGKIVLVTEET
jgi:putative PIG3 family NAD(P)H quinone oxidoreductase